MTPPSNVMAGLVPAIHAFVTARKTWMPGTSPGMTMERLAQVDGDRAWALG
jgi:hypothetical protein